MNPFYYLSLSDARELTPWLQRALAGVKFEKQLTMQDRKLCHYIPEVKENLPISKVARYVHLFAIVAGG